METFTCPQCLGHGYPPSTIGGFNKVDGEMCPTCQGEGIVLAEPATKPRRLVYACHTCGAAVPATTKVCPRCLTSQV